MYRNHQGGLIRDAAGILTILMSNSMIPYLKADKIDVFLEKSNLTKVNWEGKDDLNIPLSVAKTEQELNMFTKKKKEKKERYIHKQDLMKAWTHNSKTYTLFRELGEKTLTIIFVNIKKQIIEV